MKLRLLSLIITFLLPGFCEATTLLKQSTAVVIQLGPFVDIGDGSTLEVGLVSALDHGTTGIKLSKNGGTLTIRHATVTATTYDAHGFYKVTLDTTDTNTLGSLTVAYSDATALPVWKEYMVVPALTYDNTITNGIIGGDGMTQMPTDVLVAGSLSVIYPICIKNTAGVALTGLTSASSGLAMSYGRADQGNAAATAITPQSATRGTWTSGGFVEKDATKSPCWYEFHIPNAAIAAGADIVYFNFYGVSGMMQTSLPIALVTAGLSGVMTRLGTPSGVSISADNAANKAVVDAIKIKTDGLNYSGTNVLAFIKDYDTGKFPVQPTVEGRTLDISATGGAGVDWANIKAPTTTQALTGTTISTSQAVASAGTVTTVTNLTNAPTAGDLTATMKTSVITAATAATPVAASISGVTFPANFGSSSISTAGLNQAATYQKNVASQPGFFVFFWSLASPGTGVTGLGSSWTMNVAKDTGALGAAAGTKSEKGGGLYFFQPADSDTNCNSCGFLATGTGASPYSYGFQTIR